MTYSYDPLQFADELQAAGIPQQQASIHARAIGAAVADANDFSKMVECLRKEFRGMEDRLISRMEVGRAEWKAESAEIKGDTTAIRAEVKSMRTEFIIHRWVMGGIAGLAMAYVAMVMRILYP